MQISIYANFIKIKKINDKIPFNMYGLYKYQKKYVVQIRNMRNKKKCIVQSGKLHRKIL